MDESADLRARILTSAAKLIAKEGRDAATTRAVCAAANVQAPTLYRLFGDKQGLLDAVAEHQLASYVAKKAARTPHSDPLQELRDGWDLHVEFGLAHPGLFAIMNGDPRPRPMSPTLAAGVTVLQRRIKNLALAGRLRVSEERALALIHATGTGVVLGLLRQPPGQRDLGLAEVAREAVIAAITGASPKRGEAGPGAAASALRASLDRTSVLSAGERLLLDELLNRIANGP